jgi:hypothetical protein
MCRCGKVVSDHADPPPQSFTEISSGEEEKALDEWAAAAAGYVKAVETGRRNSWLAEHFPATEGMQVDYQHGEVLYDLLDVYLGPLRRNNIVCPHCGRLWRETAPGSPQQTSFLPEEPLPGAP